MPSVCYLALLRGKGNFLISLRLEIVLPFGASDFDVPIKVSLLGLHRH